MHCPFHTLQTSAKHNMNKSDLSRTHPHPHTAYLASSAPPTLNSGDTGSRPDSFSSSSATTRHASSGALLFLASHLSVNLGRQAGRHLWEWAAADS
jgi:hypothetical protein